MLIVRPLFCNKNTLTKYSLVQPFSFGHGEKKCALNFHTDNHNNIA